MEPQIASVVSDPASLILAKIVLTTVFWTAGLSGIFNFKGTVQAMIRANLPAPGLFAIATIACHLVGSFLVIFNPAGLGWLGAGALAVFLILTIPIAHAFWRFDEPKRTQEIYVVFEHIAVIGGLMLAGIISVAW
jgi:transmembrane protein